jgi:hypothetical protein
MGSRQDRVALFFKLLNKSIVIVHYIPGFFFCQICPLKGWFSRLKFCKLMINKKIWIATPRLTIATPRLTIATPRLAEWESHFTNISANLKPKIGTAQNVVQGTYAEPIHAKTSKNRPHCHVPLMTSPACPQVIGDIVLITDRLDELDLDNLTNLANHQSALQLLNMSGWVTMPKKLKCIEAKAIMCVAVKVTR